MGVRILTAGATTEALHFLLNIVCRPIIGKDYFEEFHIHFISPFMLSVLSAYIKNVLLRILMCLSQPFKKRGGEPLRKKELLK